VQEFGADVNGVTDDCPTPISVAIWIDDLDLRDTWSRRSAPMLTKQIHLVQRL
jgi:hypothetical protein